MSIESPPIIVKRIKKGGHGHHGGAWKVAFADFVTAMMAFFMLMWLLGSTTPEQRASISDYMKDPVAANGPGGTGANIVLDGGSGILAGQGPSPSNQARQSDEEIEGKGIPTLEDAEAIAAKAEQARMEELMIQLKASVEASQALKPFKDQLLLDITSEGLRIQLIDKENRAMFAQGSPVLENYMRSLLHEVSTVINEVPNKISISGHTDKTPYASSNGYSNWELSADRANAARRELMAAGVSEPKISRVVGLASSVLFDKEHPFGPANRRITIIVMNKAAENATEDRDDGKATKTAKPPLEKSPAAPIHEALKLSATPPVGAAGLATPPAAPTRSIAPSSGKIATPMATLPDGLSAASAGAHEPAPRQTTKLGKIVRIAVGQ